MANQSVRKGQSIHEVLCIMEDHNTDDESHAFLQKHMDKYLHSDIINVYYNHSVNYHIFHSYGITMLQHACCNRRPKTAKLLLDSGANVNGSGILTYHCVSPLLFACMNCDYACISLLIQYGADVNCVDSNGIAPLNTIMGEHMHSVGIKCAKLIIEAGANVDDSVAEQSLFVCVCRDNDLEYALLLINADCICDLNAIKNCNIIGPVLYAIDCHEAKKEHRMQQLAMVKRASEY